MKNTVKNLYDAYDAAGFWEALEILAAESPVVIDRPKGCPHPKHRELIYPLDYGYLQETAAMDGEGVDVWLGSRQEKTPDAVVCVVDLAKRETELKLLMGCTEEEKEAVYRFHNQTGQMKGLLILRPAHLQPAAEVIE